MGYWEDDGFHRATADDPVGSTPQCRPRVALVAHAIKDQDGMGYACAQLIRHAHTDVDFVAISAELSADLAPLVRRWLRVRVPMHPLLLKFPIFFAAAGWALRRAQADLVHTVGAIVPNRVDIAAIHYHHLTSQEALRVANADRTVLRRVNGRVYGWLAKLAERWCYRPSRLRAFAPVSRGVAMKLSARHPGIATTVVSNGVDPTRFAPDAETRRAVRSSLGVAPDDVVSLFVGGNWDHKGLAIAIEATSRVRGRGLPVTLWVVGEGDRARFEEIARRAGTLEAVQFFGRQAAVEQFYAAADLFIIPTASETFSLVCYEAAASGLPILATPVDGITELVGDNEAGLLVVRSVAAFAEGLEELAKDRQRRQALGSEARRRASVYTWEAAVAEMLTLYRQLLSAEQRPRPSAWADRTELTGQ